MLNQSVFEEEVEKVSKITIIILSAGLIIFVSVATIFVGLAVFKGSQSFYFEDIAANLKNTNIKLLKEKTQLTTKRNAMQQQNSELLQQFSVVNANHTELANKNRTLHDDITYLEANISLVKNQIFLCGITNGISLLYNGLVVRYILSLKSKISSLKTEISSFQELYYKAMDYSLSAMLQSKERRSWSKMSHIYDGSGTLSKEDFTTNINGLSDTAILYQTEAGEVIGLVLHEKWVFGAPILDSTAYTYSFRKSMKANSDTGVTAVDPDEGLFRVGTNEITLELKKTGKAQTNQGYTPEKTQEDPSDFYVSSGAYDLSQLQIGMERKLNGLITGVQSGDVVVIQGGAKEGNIPPSKELYLAYIEAPKMQTPHRKADPFGFLSREYLRKLIIGQKIKFVIEYTKDEKDYGTIWVNDTTDVVMELVKEGLAEVRVRGKASEVDSSLTAKPRFELLLEIQNEAKKGGKGKWTRDEEKQKENTFVVSLPGTPGYDVSKIQTELEKLGNRVEGIVEYVGSPYGYSVLVPQIGTVVKFSLEYVKGVLTGSKSTESQQKLNQLGKLYAEKLIQHHNVVLQITDYEGTAFQGRLTFDNLDVAAELLKCGFLKLKVQNPEMDATYYSILRVAMHEALHQIQGKN